MSIRHVKTVQFNLEDMRNMIKDSGLTREELAKRLGISARTLRRYLQIGEMPENVHYDIVRITDGRKYTKKMPMVCNKCKKHLGYMVCSVPIESTNNSKGYVSQVTKENRRGGLLVNILCDKCASCRHQCAPKTSTIIEKKDQGV